MDHRRMNHPAEIQRPSVWSALLSPTVLPSLLGSVALGISFFLPQTRIFLQFEISAWELAGLWWTVPAFDLQDRLLAVVVFWPYLFGICSAGVMITLSLQRSSQLRLGLMVLPITFMFALSILWLTLLFSGSENSRTAMVVAVLVAPFATVVGARMLWLWRGGQPLAAAAWGHSFLCVLAVFSLRWFCYPPVGPLLKGGVLSIVAMMLIMMGSWTWSYRAHQDLVNRLVPPLRFQMSMQQLIIAVMVIAIVLAYWRTLSVWLPGQNASPDDWFQLAEWR